MKYLFVFLLVGLTSVVNSQTVTAKQPNCDEIEGVVFMFSNSVPKDFTGTAKWCDGKSSPDNYIGDTVINGQSVPTYSSVFGKGKVTSFANYKNGKQDGLERVWSRENGRLVGEYFYKNDELDSLQRVWYKNGQLKKEINYKNGKQDGLFREWYKNGQLEYAWNYKNGIEDGLLRGWYESGQLYRELQYQFGMSKFKIKEWHENGKLKLKAIIDEEFEEFKCWDEGGNRIECPEEYKQP